MDFFFGVPITTLLLILSAGVALLFGWLAYVGWRARILFRLGARNLPRRPLRAAFIVAGLMLSTTVIGSALGAGDTMSWTVRSVVTASLGTVDEVVVLNPPRSDGGRLNSLVEPGIGALAAARLDYFPDREAARLFETGTDDTAVAGYAPAIAEQLTVVFPAGQHSEAAMLVLAVPRDYPEQFGRLEDAGTDGGDVSLADLGPDDVVLNAAAAEEFAVTGGDTLRIHAAGFVAPEGEEPGWPVRIAAVARDGGFAGAQPAVIVPLDRFQEISGRDGWINAVLVVNDGGVRGVDRTDAATEDLRVALVNREVAQRLFEILGGPEAQRGLLEAQAVLEAEDRARAIELREEAARPEMSDRFISLVSDPRVRGGIYFLARDYLPDADQRDTYATLGNISNLTVLPVKQQGLERADEYGSVVTTVFLVLGVVSIAASIILIFLIFSLLAADRGFELATMRALGMRDRQVMGIFLVEGLVYDLLGALLGALGGLLAAWLTITSISGTLAGFGFHVQRHVELRSMAVAFALGVLITFAAMLVAAWRVSRAGIVAATHGELEDERRGWAFVLGAMLLAAGGMLWWWQHVATATRPFYETRHPLYLPALRSVVLLGVVCLALGLVRRRYVVESLVVMAGVALIAIWWRTLDGLPIRRVSRQDEAVTAAVASLIVLVAAVWTTARLLGPGLSLVDRLLRPFGRLRAVVRPAQGQLGRRRGRTAAAAVMFAAVIFIMVAALTMIDVLLNAYDRDEAPVAGFQVRVDSRTIPSTDALAQSLAESESVAPAAFDAIGGIAQVDVAVVQLGEPVTAWRGAPLSAADAAFLNQSQVALARRASGYDDARAVWSALAREPGMAVISPGLSRSGSGIQVSGAGEREFEPFTLWARPADADGDGAAVKLTVIGIIDPSAELPPGIYTSVATAAGLGMPLTPHSYYFALAPDTRLDDALTGLELTFEASPIGQDAIVTDLGDSLRVSRSVRTLLTRVVQGFMGLGLIAGVAALGILGIQSVVERRQQFGTLRALGFTGGDLRATLALESFVIALLGVAVGVATGLALARALVDILATDNPEIVFSVPWGQITIVGVIAWCGSLGAIAAATLQAGRVSAAEAMRAA